MTAEGIPDSRTRNDPIEALESDLAARAANNEPLGAMVRDALDLARVLQRERDEARQERDCARWERDEAWRDLDEARRRQDTFASLARDASYALRDIAALPSFQGNEMRLIAHEALDRLVAGGKE